MSLTCFVCRLHRVWSIPVREALCMSLVLAHVLPSAAEPCRGQVCFTYCLFIHVGAGM